MKSLALLLFALSPVSLLAATDFSRCVPNPRAGLVPGEITLGKNGQLAVDRKSLERYAENDSVVIAHRKVPGQSGLVKAELKRSGGLPRELNVTFPGYDSHEPSFAVTTSFDYQNGECFVSEILLKEHDGTDKGKRFVRYHQRLCREMQDAFGGKAAEAANYCASALGKMEQVLGKYEAAFSKRGLVLHSHKSDTSAASVPFLQLMNLVGDCRSMEERYTPPTLLEKIFGSPAETGREGSLPAQ